MAATCFEAFEGAAAAAAFFEALAALAAAATAATLEDWRSPRRAGGASSPEEALRWSPSEDSSLR